MSVFQKIAQFANSPQGRKLMNQAKEMANDPRRRQQAKDAVEKLRRRASELGEQQRRPGDRRDHRDHRDGPGGPGGPSAA